MIRPLLLLLLLLFLAACSGISDTRPELLRSSERMLERGVEAHTQGDYSMAIDLFTRALAQYRSVDYRIGMLHSHLNLAETALASGQLTYAAKHIRELESLARELRDPASAQRAALLWARWYQQDGQTAQAIATLDSLLPPFSNGKPAPVPNPIQLAALTLRSDLALQQNVEPLLWLARLEQGLAMQSQADPWTQARLWRLQARWLASEGDVEQGLTLLEQSLNTYREAARRQAVAATLAEVARLHGQAGNYALAEDHYQRALLIRVWMMDRRHSRELLEELVELYRRMGEDTKARESAALAAQIDSEQAWQELRQAIRPR